MKIIATPADDATVLQMTPLCSLTVGGLHNGPVPREIVQVLGADGIALDAALLQLRTHHQILVRA